VEDLRKEVVTYRHFMNASGGGVTASGGEAILQAEFVRDWFRAKRLDYLLLQSHLTPFDIKKMNLYPVKANPSPLKRQGLAG
ncbi:hypothetical protein ONN26_26315, partial [Salmonella enterica subsp. enterica serovar Muenster]|nr:hypothetical protein [Salmonella enterica subsp. enterica serovar Muenster]